MKKVCIIIEWKGIDLVMKKLVLAMAGLVIILAMLCPVTAAASNKDSERFPVEQAVQEKMVFNVDFSTGTGNDLCGGTLASNGIIVEEDSSLGVNVGVCGEYYNRYEIAPGLINYPINEFAIEAYVYLSSEQTPWSHIISSRNEMFDMTDYAGWKGSSEDDQTMGIGMRIGNSWTYISSENMTQYYDQWIHFVIQGQFGESLIFINGELIKGGMYQVDSNAAQGVIGAYQSFGEIFVGGLDTATLGVPGTDSGSVMDTVEGKIAYVRMYNKILKFSQISALYETTKTGVLNTTTPAPTPTSTPILNITNNTTERFPVETALLNHLVFNVDFSTGTGDDLCGGTLANNGIIIENDSILDTNVGVCGEYYNRYEVASGLITASPLNEFAYEALVYLSSEQTPWSHIISSRNEMFDMTDFAGWKGPLAEDPTIGLGMRLGNQYIFIPAEEMAAYYDQWIHVVIQGEFGEGFIYINGDLIAAGAYDISSSAAQGVAGVDQAFGEIFIGGLDTSTTGAIGTDSGTVMDTVEGKIAYVRMYNTYLEDTQISTLYQTTITPVTGPVFGDVNGDGEINPMDATILNRYNACWPTYVLGTNIIADNCDLNNDGNINPLDGTILARHNANWLSFISLPWGINT